MTVRKLAIAAGIGVVVGLGGAIAAGIAAARVTMASRFVAKELCSCTFVMRQGEAYCRDYASAGPTWLVHSTVDRKGVVEARAMLAIHSRASWKGTGFGCTLDY